MKFSIEQQLGIERGKVKALEEQLERESDHRRSLEKILLRTIEMESDRRYRDLRDLEKELLSPEE